MARRERERVRAEREHNTRHRERGKKQLSTIMHSVRFNNPEVAESVTCKVEMAR
jgi:hypothetical protein